MARWLRLILLLLASEATTGFFSGSTSSSKADEAQGAYNGRGFVAGRHGLHRTHHGKANNARGALDKINESYRRRQQQLHADPVLQSPPSSRQLSSSHQEPSATTSGSAASATPQAESVKTHFGVGIYLLNIDAADFSSGYAELDFDMYIKQCISTEEAVGREPLLSSDGTNVTQRVCNKYYHSYLSGGSNLRTNLTAVAEELSFPNSPPKSVSKTMRKFRENEEFVHITGVFYYRVDMGNFPFNTQTLQIDIEWPRFAFIDAELSFLRDYSGLSSNIRSSTARMEHMSFDWMVTQKCYPPYDGPTCVENRKDDKEEKDTSDAGQPSEASESATPPPPAPPPPYVEVETRILCESSGQMSKDECSDVTDASKFSRFTFFILLSPSPWRSYVKTLFPEFVILCAMFAVLVYNPATKVETRTVGCTAALTSVVLQQVNIQNQVPQGTGLTLADRFTMVVYVIILLGFTSTAFFSRWLGHLIAHDRKDKKEAVLLLHSQMDCALFFIAAFVLHALVIACNLFWLAIGSLFVLYILFIALLVQWGQNMHRVFVRMEYMLLGLRHLFLPSSVSGGRASESDDGSGIQLLERNPNY